MSTLAPQQMDIVLSAIANGDLDPILDKMLDRIARRRDVVARLRTATIDVGDTVRFTERIRPRYLAGLTATVVKINQTTITVACPDTYEYERFRGASSVRCNLTLIERA